MATEKAFFGGGCFWCIEAVFQKLDGVHSVISGYANGSTDNPDYEQICSGTSGHAEVIQISYDPEIISYRLLLQVFFTIHDPTTLNRQGNDVGSQYRSTILYQNESQQSDAQKIIDELNTRRIWPDPIVTIVEPLDIFYEAEPYHQDYYNLNPENRYCQVMINPKLEKLKKMLEVGELNQ